MYIQETIQVACQGGDHCAGNCANGRTIKFFVVTSWHIPEISPISAFEACLDQRTPPATSSYTAGDTHRYNVL